MTREGKTTQSAAIVVFSSALVNPAFGWSLTMLLDNLGLVGYKERSGELSKMSRWVLPGCGANQCDGVSWTSARDSSDYP